MSAKKVQMVKFVLTVVGAAIAGVMVASNALVYGYELPWPGIVLGAVVGGIVGYWAGRCLFSKKETK